MNLVTDPWIPVIMPDGGFRTAGLAELFENAGHIQDLAANPIQRIALMRLLICISQAALDGPKDEEDWYGCRERLPAMAGTYLGKWKSAFQLRGQKPFMQIPELAVDEGNEAVLDKLDFRLSSGNNATLFDHGGSRDGRNFGEKENALNLLTFLNFSTGGKIGQANWKGRKYSDSTFAAPCFQYAHTFILGQNMLDTIFFNMLSKNGAINGVVTLPNGKWGRPVWEQFPGSVDDEPAFSNASETYLGRLVPLSRFIRLGDDSESAKCIIGPTHKEYAIQNLPAFREPWLTVVQNKKGENYSLRVSSGRHMWRDLGSLLSLKRTESGPGGALPLDALYSFYHAFPDTIVNIWVGGMEKGATAAKINDMVEWNFRIPVSQFQENHLKKYQNGVHLAEAAEGRLKDAVKHYYSQMKVRNPPYEKARHGYWTELDRRYDVLIADANDPYAYLGNRWYTIVRGAMEKAHEISCPHETPRQIQVFAESRKRLKLKKPEE